MSSTGTVEGSGRLRLFCALTLPDAVLDRLVQWQAVELSKGERMDPRGNLHVTVAFLGSRSAADVGPVAAELGVAACGAGTLAVIACSAGLCAEPARDTFCDVA